MSSPASSASLCPGCGKAVDPLRAGHVAIVEGAFRYFCSRECKDGWASGETSRKQALEAETREPPRVAPLSTSQSSGVRPQTTSTTREAPPASFPPVETKRPDDSGALPRFPFEEETFDEADDAATSDRRLEADFEDAPPATLRSEPTDPALEGEDEGQASREVPAVEEARADSPAPSRVDVATLAPFVGIAAGVLAAMVALVGDSGAPVRLPLALLAAAIVVGRAVLVPRDPAEPSPLVVVAPVALAAGCAVAARVMHAPRADAHASFVGLASAATLLGAFLVARGRQELETKRRRIVEALDVEANVVKDDVVTTRAAAQVKPGEQVVVEAGETIAVDGIVTAGTADVAPWVDAPIVLAKKEGDAVVAGAMVVSGRLRVNTTFSGAERAWLKLACDPVARIDVAAPIVTAARRLVERGAPVVGLVVAVAVFASNGAWLDVVVAACAGAFGVGIASAVAVVALSHGRAHLGALARGIAYKDASAFDTAARVDVAVMCSRGTILRGEPELVAIESASGGTTAAEVERVLSLAAGAEMASTHPFAAAIVGAARTRGVRPENVRSGLKHSGLGVTALAANGDKVIVGSRAFLLQERISVAIADARVNALEAEGRSVLLVAMSGRLVGLLALQDALRQGARAAVQRLHDAHVEPVLLSGEARDTCETIARALEIEHVRPEILPSDRGAEVRALGEGGHVVAALGHPSSDDGALGAADVSIAMGAAGAAPGEWSIALASDDVRDAALALSIARGCRDRAKTTLVIGAAAQALATFTIAFGLAPPAIAPILAVLAAAGASTIPREPLGGSSGL